MGCPPVRGESTSFGEWLSDVQVDEHGITILYNLHHEIFHAKVGKGGINVFPRSEFECTHLGNLNGT